MKPRQQTSNKPSRKMLNSENSRDFLLTQFEKSTDLIQHVESNIDREVQYYFSLASGVIGAIIATIGYALQFNMYIGFPLAVAHTFGFVLLVAGMRLLRRITHLTSEKALEWAQTALIRRYFIDQDESIQQYVLLTTASKDRSAHDYTPVSQQLSLRVLGALNSIIVLLVILAVPIHFYIYIGQMFQKSIWMIVFTTAGLLAVLAALFTLKYQRNWTRSRGDTYLERITSRVQKRLKYPK